MRQMRADAGRERREWPPGVQHEMCARGGGGCGVRVRWHTRRVWAHACVEVVCLNPGVAPHSAVALSPTGLEPGPSDVPLPGRHRNVCIRSSSGRSSGRVPSPRCVRCACAAPGQGPEER